MSYNAGSIPLDAHLIIHGDSRCVTELNVTGSRHGSISSLDSGIFDPVDKEESLAQCEHPSSEMSARDDCRRHHHRRPSVALKFNKPIIYN